MVKRWARPPPVNLRKRKTPDSIILVSFLASLFGAHVNLYLISGDVSGEEVFESMVAERELKGLSGRVRMGPAGFAEMKRARESK